MDLAGVGRAVAKCNLRALLLEALAQARQEEELHIVRTHQREGASRTSRFKGVAALELGRPAVGIELDPELAQYARDRVAFEALPERRLVSTALPTLFD